MNTPKHPASPSSTRSTPPDLQIRNLSIEREYPILRNINWTVKAGEKHQTLTSANLSEAFNASIKLRQSSGRYSLKIQSESKKVFS